MTEPMVITDADLQAEKQIAEKNGEGFVMLYAPRLLGVANLAIQRDEENKRLREIVEALASAAPLSSCTEQCTVCSFDDWEHDPTCPYRRAVEYVQERSEG